MTATPATKAAERAGIEHRVHRYEHDPRAEGYGEEAAEAMGVEPARVFKTLVVDIDGRLATAVVPVTGRLDLKAAAAALGAKRCELADPEAAQRATGYVLGGISPLGQKRRLPTVIDTSTADWPTVYVSGGRRGLEIELAPADLVRATGAVLASITTR